MNRIASVAVWVYSQGLRLYPGSFYTSFGIEMRDVFTLAIADAAKCGIIPAIRTTMRELGELPENIILEHACEQKKRLIQSFDSPQELLAGGVEMLEKPVTVAGYSLLIAAFIGYLVVTIIGLVDVLPEGIVGLLAIAGFGLLLIKVIKDRLTNKEDNYYSKNVKQ
jgi:hypothetical protein